VGPDGGVTSVRGAAAVPKVALLTVVGWAYMLTVAVGGIAASVAITVVLFDYLDLRSLKFGLKAVIAMAAFSVGLIVAAFRAVWQSPPEPPGVLLEKTEAGRLYGTVAQLAKRLGAPPIATVRAVGTGGIRGIPVPLFGPLPLYGTGLVVDVRLLDRLSWDEARALLAREIAMLGGPGRRVDAWVLRSVRGWAALHGALEQNAVRRVIYGLFLGVFRRQLEAAAEPAIERLVEAAGLRAAEATDPADLLAAMSVADRPRSRRLEQTAAQAGLGKAYVPIKRYLQIR